MSEIQKYRPTHCPMMDEHGFDVETLGPFVEYRDYQHREAELQAKNAALKDQVARLSEAFLDISRKGSDGNPCWCLEDCGVGGRKMHRNHCYIIRAALAPPSP